MLAIKLQRIGKKHQPSYRVVVAERRSKMGAPPVEDLGAYSSFTKASTLKKDRVAHWLKVGAQPTATVHNLLVKEGVLNEPKVRIKVTVKAKEGSESAVPAAESSAPASQETAPAV